MNTFVVILLILASLAVVMVIGSFIVGLIWTKSFKGAVNALKEMIEALPYILGYLIGFIAFLSIIGFILKIIEITHHITVSVSESSIGFVPLGLFLSADRQIVYRGLLNITTRLSMLYLPSNQRSLGSPMDLV